MTICIISLGHKHGRRKNYSSQGLVEAKIDKGDSGIFRIC